ncbi:MAG: hypothetical protein WB562_12710 [Candidatus Sulfotelmatobacter sp.]
MRLLRLVAVAVLACAPVAAIAQSDAQKTLDRFKSMVGTWEGKDAKGGPVEDSYKLTAGGTAVMGENKMGEEDMLSLFYVDGERLLMTHFCPSGNQPRMKATFSPDGKTVTFNFIDATNLPDLQAGHMSNAVYVFTEADHYIEEWTWSKGGKTPVFHFEMQRKK